MSETNIPDPLSYFVPWGNYKHIKKILSSYRFFPLLISGQSGNGKTLGVEQACAELKRPFFRVNFNRRTDEDDLIYHIELKDGSTVVTDGPVVRALRTKNAVLVLDEIDAGDPGLILCLQSVMEGNGVLIKKTGEFVKPAEGFTVVATANTLGKGSSDGRFIGTNTLNEAFLDRFPACIIQDYPPEEVEKKILMLAFDHFNKGVDFTDKQLNEVSNAIKVFLKWANIIRKTFNEGGIDETISTRRLVSIMNSYGIFFDIVTSVKHCVSRFEPAVADAMLDALNSVNPDGDIEEEESESEGDGTEDFVL